jgi:hypothetical protein
VVDQQAYRIVDPTDGTVIGRQGPWGRSRVVFALPLNETPAQWRRRPTAIHDQDGCYLADPDDNLIGRPGLWIGRMTTARWTEDTRRLAG